MRSTPDYRAAVLHELASLREAELQSQIIEPLLSIMGFKQVRDTSGANDKGKDLIAIKPEFGKDKLYAIQIKKLRFSGKHNRPNALTHVLVQLRQLFSEPVIDPSSNSLRTPDRAVFITPYAISRHALESAFEQLRETEKREIMVIDGPQLVDLILEHMPEALRKRNAVLQYRLQFTAYANRIRESGAFGLPTELALDAIYVDLAVSSITHTRLTALASAASKRGMQLLHIHPRHLEALSRVYREVTGEDLATLPVSKPRSDFRTRMRHLTLKTRSRIGQLHDRLTHPSSRDLDAREKTALTDKLTYLRNLQFLQAELDKIVTALSIRAKGCVSRISKLAAADSTPDQCTEHADFIISTSNMLRDIDRLPELREYCPGLYPPESPSASTNRLPANALLKIRQNVFIMGGPGAGKTTLLRMLSHNLAHAASDQLPVLVSLVRAHESGGDLMRAAVSSLLELGLKVTERRFSQGLRSGKYRLYLDGLDETGDSADTMFCAIQDLASRCPLVQVLVTGRDTFEYRDWPGSFRITIAPFDDRQLGVFFSKWFANKPTHLRQVTSWVAGNPALRDAARTPMVAALLCSIVQAGADLPTSQIELYEQWYQLLLGRWETAKGMAPLPAHLRPNYWHLLMKLAFKMQSQTLRRCPFHEALLIAEDLFDPKFHGAADVMVVDCIQRGALQRETQGMVSFGHWTKQEFLCARWLAHLNALELVASHLDDPWWHNTDRFWALIRKDVTDLVERCARELPKSGFTKREKDRIQRLVELAECAHLTSRRVALVLTDLAECVHFTSRSATLVDLTNSLKVRADRE